MEFISEELQDYINEHTDAEPAMLIKHNRETFARHLNPRMLSGHYQGRLLSMLSKMINPANILEIGTYTGYSAVCLAEGLKPGGRLITIDINDELAEVAQKYFIMNNLQEQVKLINGNASAIIPSLNIEFDLVFIDADKENYSNYYDLVIDKVKPGGYIIADNVLWSGQVIYPLAEQDHDTKMICEFNDKVNADERVNNVMLPVRDGLMLVRKKDLHG